MRRRTSPQGFTLIELLVALVVMALLSVAAYRGLDSVLQVRERLAAETRKWQRLSFFFARLEQDIAQATFRPVRDQGGITQPPWVGHKVVVGEDDAELTFTRAGIAEQGGVPQRIAYRLEQGDVVLLRWPALDQGERAEPIRYPMLEGAREFKLRYLGDANRWFDDWPAASAGMALPKATEVTLTLASGETITRIFALQ